MEGDRPMAKRSLISRHFLRPTCMSSKTTPTESMAMVMLTVSSPAQTVDMHAQTTGLYRSRKAAGDWETLMSRTPMGTHMRRSINRVIALTLL